MPDLFLTLFPESHRVYTLDEIAGVVHRSAEQAREAQNTLSERAATREAVQPLDGRRPAHYSPEAARLIGRHLVRGEEREELRRQTDSRMQEMLDVAHQNQALLLTLLQQLGPLLRVMQVIARMMVKQTPPDSPQNPP